MGGAQRGDRPGRPAAEHERTVREHGRSQTLVDRQLGLIAELERDEVGAARLEQLFKLGDRGTRMRRHAERLILLPGSGPGHRWTEPVPLTPCCAAVSEIVV